MDTSWTECPGGSRAQTRSAHCWPLQALSGPQTPFLQPPEPMLDLFAPMGGSVVGKARAGAVARGWPEQGLCGLGSG